MDGVDRRISLAVARTKMVLADHPEVRPGQAFWNSCEELFPGICKQFAGNAADCYHDDRAIFTLLHHLMWRNKKEDDS